MKAVVCKVEQDGQEVWMIGFGDNGVIKDIVVVDEVVVWESFKGLKVYKPDKNWSISDTFKLAAAS